MSSTSKLTPSLSVLPYDPTRISPIPSPSQIPTPTSPRTAVQINNTQKQKLTLNATSVLNPANSTASPIPAATTQAVAFAGAAKASEVPFTSGIVPSTTAPSASEKTGAANANGRQGAVGAAALFGAGIVGMAVL